MEWDEKLQRIISCIENSLDYGERAIDEKEIAEKIKIQMEGGNHDRLLSNIDKESTSWKARAKELQDFLTGRG